MSRKTILAADIGGTNTRLLLYEIVVDEVLSTAVPQGKLAPGSLLLHKKYMNQDFTHFIDILKQFLDEAHISQPPISACFAVAGPVKDNIVRFTNRGEWIINGYDIERELGISSVKLINDFVANGYGLLTLNEDKECITLQSAQKNLSAPIACIGAGTGLGECFLAPNASGEYTCFPSEGGHAEYAPRNDLEVELLEFLKTRFQHKKRVSVERVVSGTGLVNIYDFFCQRFPEKVNQAVKHKVDTAGDLKGAVISKEAENDEICAQTMEIFVTAYGSEAGVAALKWLPFGGLYITGGLTPKNIDLIRNANGPFMEAFMDKGRVSGMLCSVPVFAVMAEDLGQRGAHLRAYQEAASILLRQRVPVEAVETKSSAGDDSATRVVFATVPSSSVNPYLLAATAAALAGVLYMYRYVKK